MYVDIDIYIHIFPSEKLAGSHLNQHNIGYKYNNTYLGKRWLFSLTRDNFIMVGN